MALEAIHGQLHPSPPIYDPSAVKVFLSAGVNDVLRKNFANYQKSLDKISEQERNHACRWKNIPTCIPPGFLNMARCKEKTLASP